MHDNRQTCRIREKFKLLQNKLLFFKKTISILTISIKKESIEQVVIKHNLKGYFRCISNKDFDR